MLDWCIYWSIDGTTEYNISFHLNKMSWKVMFRYLIGVQVQLHLDPEGHKSRISSKMTRLEVQTSRGSLSLPVAASDSLALSDNFRKTVGEFWSGMRIRIPDQNISDSLLCKILQSSGCRQEHFWGSLGFYNPWKQYKHNFFCSSEVEMEIVQLWFVVYFFRIVKWIRDAYFRHGNRLVFEF